MGIDQTLELAKSTEKGILSSVLKMLKNDYNIDTQVLQDEINSKRVELLEYKKDHFFPESIDFGDVIDVCVKCQTPAGTKKAKQSGSPAGTEKAKQSGSPVGTEKAKQSGSPASTETAQQSGLPTDTKKAKQSYPEIRLLLIVNSKKKFSDEECRDPEKFESVEGIDSRIIVIRLFEYCRKNKVQNVMLGAMGTNGLNFPYYVIVREIVNAYCYWFGQLAFDSTSPLNVILSLRMKDITRHAGELSKIISYVDWMIDRRKETITK